MELYNEFKDSSLNIIISTFNDCVNNGSGISRKKLYNKLQLRKGEDPAVDVIIGALFVDSTKDKDIINPLPEYFDITIPNLPSLIERDWLFSILRDEKSAAIIGEKLKEKLYRLLSHGNEPSFNWVKKNWQTPGHVLNKDFESACYVETFKKALSALDNKNYVYYESHDIYGNTYKGKAAPYKIEYVGCTESFNFIMWNEEKKWTFKSDIATIDRLDILCEHYTDDVTKKADSYVASIKDKTEPILLKLNSTHTNALERCCNLFAEYDKELSRAEDGIFYLKIHHRDHFDKAEITQYILSLGSSVVVIEPEKLREEIIETIKESFTR